MGKWVHRWQPKEREYIKLVIYKIRKILLSFCQKYYENTQR